MKKAVMPLPPIVGEGAAPGTFHNPVCFIDAGSKLGCHNEFLFQVPTFGNLRKFTRARRSTAGSTEVVLQKGWAFGKPARGSGDLINLPKGSTCLDLLGFLSLS
jgi:hypothetical protein